MPCHRDPGREPAFAGDEATTPGAWPYWQRREHGVPVSALFLADGRDAQVLGISEQQVEGDALAPATPRGAGGGAAPVARPYAFAGALAGLPPALAGRGFEAALEAACRRLARHFGLRGLCSLDALAGPQGLRCLEVNARPSATLALHDGAVPGGLMAAHVAACRGEGLPGPRMPPAAAGGDARGFRVVVAPRAAGFGPAALRAAARTPWCHDRPAAPQALAAGQPVCTVRAEGATRDAVHALLAQRAAEVLQWLDAAPLAGQAAAQAPAQEPVREPVQPAAAWPVPPPPAVTGERPAAPAAWADPCPNDR
jgi:predicted ATP-grasp superfamily ATP-dependent carboligase